MIVQLYNVYIISVKEQNIKRDRTIVKCIHNLRERTEHKDEIVEIYIEEKNWSTDVVSNPENVLCR